LTAQNRVVSNGVMSSDTSNESNFLLECAIGNLDRARESVMSVVMNDARRTENQNLEPESRKQEARSRKPEAGGRESEARSRKLEAGRWMRDAERGNYRSAPMSRSTSAR
jgi:hypothetical protein